MHRVVDHVGEVYRFYDDVVVIVQKQDDPEEWECRSLISLHRFWVDQYFFDSERAFVRLA